MKFNKRLAAVITAAACSLSAFCFAGCSDQDSKQNSEPTATVDPTSDNYRVFYEIFVGSFSDSDGDGIGDLRGIINRLDYLNDGDINSGDDLGVQGIWLSPIFSSSSYHKYDTNNYEKISSDFGDEETLKELVDECHKRNVKVILDLAINHTSSNNNWFINFKNAIKNVDTSDPYYDFYTHVTANEKVGGRTYYQIAGSDQYYEANFDSSMPELNYDNEAVREKMVEVAKKWLDLGVDGFRFDAIKYIYYNDTPKNTEFWQWYVDELKQIKSDIYTVGECWSSDSEVIQYYPALNCFNFTSSQTEGQIAAAAKGGSVSYFTGYVASYVNKIREQRLDAMYAPFIANHDTDRAAGYLTVSSHQAHMAANLYLLCSGSPFIYYGEEIGMKGTRGTANTDANRRLAMLWGDGDKVKNPTGSTYEVSKQINGTVAEQLEADDSLLKYYGKVIALRLKYPEIPRGNYEAINFSSTVGGFKITYNGETTYLIHNVSTEEKEITLSDDVKAALADYIGQGEASLNGSVLKIGGQTSVILK